MSGRWKRIEDGPCAVEHLLTHVNNVRMVRHFFPFVFSADIVRSSMHDDRLTEYWVGRTTGDPRIEQIIK